MTNPERNQYRIMVVDDEAVIITQLEELLTTLGYDVVCKASTGDDAVRLARELRPDLVLMDIVMPGEKDGITACGEIQDKMDIPVILLTAYGDDAHVDRAKVVHPYGYILKPSQNDQIKAVIEIVLEKKAMERNLDDMMVGFRSQAEDRELQLKEIHHRIKNNLNMICGLLALQSMHIENEACVEALKAVRSRVVSIAKVHEKLYSSEHLDTIAARDYFESLTDSLLRSYVFPPGVELKLDCEEMELEPDKVMPVGLIVTEFLTNSLKYAFPEGGPGTISIVFSKVVGNYELVVMDDGVGLADDVDLNHPKSLGLELVRGLVAQVGGTLELSRSGGTRFTVRIPT
ncbi:response regulator [Desulfovibrio ferrophilus]|uniref:histidine kinase n=1 Tax=Desulfovibrio ferrophilus TaxID=241368 RepID=A0A2Z6AZB4_9BACT|nr:response regulator [Desulfovibrio ferrophilus]BBD08604.1 signal transduction histidine kinase [Desulfovibrio ferrophilus]